MFHSIKYFIIFILCGVIITFTVAIEKRIKYFAFERVNVTYFNKKYIMFLNATSRRYSRHDPAYYMSLHVKFNMTLDNDVKLHMYFLEFLTNQYKPSFVDLHMRACDYLNHFLFKSIFHNALGGLKCPIPPGEYYLKNCTANAGNTAALKNFPFQKGRVFVNYTLTSTGEHLAEAFSDFEIKNMNEKLIRKTKN